MIKIQNIYYMLSYAFQGLRENGLTNAGAEDFGHIHELFAQLLIHGLRRQLRQGIHREYQPETATLAGLRGQVDVSASLRQLTIQRRQLICTYDEFTEDTPANQALKAALTLLLRQGTIRPEQRAGLIRLRELLARVRDVPPRALRWDLLKTFRGSAEYKLLLRICQFLFDALLMTQQDGACRLRGWLPDEQLHRLYERFVLNYFKLHHPELRPQGQANIPWALDEEPADRSRLPAMCADILMRRGEGALIIDTKCYNKITASRYEGGGEKFHSDNLYQILSYIINWRQRVGGEVAGVLLYAKTDDVRPINDWFHIYGCQLGVMTLDLDCKWDEIVRGLESVLLVH